MLGKIAKGFWFLAKNDSLATGQGSSRLNSSKPDKYKKKHTNLQFVDSFINNVFIEPVRPVVGSVVHCGLAVNKVEHSGIYVGYNKIVHLDGSGLVEIVTPEQFLNRLGGFNMAMSIFVSSRDGAAVGVREAALMAKKMVGSKLEYSLLENNCHAFVSNCLKNHSVSPGTPHRRAKKRL